MNEKKSYYAKSTLILRLIGGGYLVYLAWGLIGAVRNNTGFAQLGFGFAMLLFALVGFLLAGYSAKCLMKGEYAENFETEPLVEEDSVEEINKID